VSRLGTALIVVGLLALGYAGLWQLGLAPGSRVSLPPPVALERPRATTTAPDALATPLPATAPRVLTTPAPAAAPTPATMATPATAATAAAAPTAAPTRIAPADAADRDAAATEAPPGYAVRLAIPAIKLDTPVRQGGIVEDARGNPMWETQPFVAVHYGDLTALIGQHSNAVIAGHVVTLNEGNVFRFLYQLDIDDRIQVWDDHQRERDYHVVDVKLVPPSDTSVMDPTPDERLTLITCGGTFDPVKREFSDRLIVVARPL
jgi:LPXTG-site transpeptidase (sortase) family protein